MRYQHFQKNLGLNVLIHINVFDWYLSMCAEADDCISDVTGHFSSKVPVAGDIRSWTLGRFRIFPW